MTKAKLEAALARIDRARTELDAACAVLSDVRGLLREWEQLGKLSTRVGDYQASLRMLAGNATKLARFDKLNPSENRAAVSMRDNPPPSPRGER